VSKVVERLESIRSTWKGTPPRALSPVNEDEVEALAAEMVERRGWVGPPVLLDGELALTGANALAAARRVKYEHGLYGDKFPIPTIYVEDLCERFGLNRGELDAAGGSDGFKDLLAKLPGEVAEYLGVK
jgi:hypothetical protein